MSPVRPASRSIFYFVLLHRMDHMHERFARYHYHIRMCKKREEIILFLLPLASPSLRSRLTTNEQHSQNIHSEREQGAGKVLACVKRVEWKVCIANETANLSLT